MLTTCLLAAALAAGVTGAWSPCGLSMVETLAPGGFARTRAESALAAATFTRRRARGRRDHVRRSRAARPAARRGRGDRPGRRRGRRGRRRGGRGARAADRAADPAPGAGGVAPRAPGGPRDRGGYGVLLGLGFTTFVLTFAVWALAGASIALGDPALGLGVGLAFGARPRAARGRAGAARARRDRGHVRAPGDPARPAPRRCRRARRGGARPGDRGAREAPARPGPREAGELYAGDAYDPAAGAGLLAWQRPGGIALLRRDGADSTLPGRHPALGGSVLAWLDGDAAVIADAATGALRDRLPAPGAQAIGVSDQILAWRAPDVEGRDVLWARALGRQRAACGSRARRAAASSAGPRCRRPGDLPRRGRRRQPHRARGHGHGRQAGPPPHAGRAGLEPRDGRHAAPARPRLGPAAGAAARAAHARRRATT